MKRFFWVSDERERLTWLTSRGDKVSYIYPAAAKTGKEAKSRAHPVK